MMNFMLSFTIFVGLLSPTPNAQRPTHIVFPSCPYFSSEADDEITPNASPAFDRDYFEKINGATLHFRVRGTSETNPTLLILHGGPGFSAQMFYPWGKSLEDRLTVVYLDQRGSGQSEKLKPISPADPKPEDGQDYTIPKLVEDIEGVRKFLKVDKWAVLGHSWGGMLGVEYVTKYPQHILGYIHMDGLISQPLAQEAIIATAGKLIAADEKSDDKTRQDRAKRVKPYLEPAKAAPIGSEHLMRAYGLAYAYFGEMYYADPKVGIAYNTSVGVATKAYGLKPTDTAMTQEPSVALELTEHYATRDVLAKLPQLSQFPTLVINGKQDGLITPEQAERVHSAAKGSTLLLLEPCGHFPFAEQPEKTTKAICDFLLESKKPSSNPKPETKTEPKIGTKSEGKSGDAKP